MSNIKVSEPEWSRLVRVRDFPGVPTPTVSGVTVGSAGQWSGGTGEVWELERTAGNQLPGGSQGTWPR